MASSSSSVTSSTSDRAAEAAVAQDRHAVGELPDLGEAVGDVDDRGARRAAARTRSKSSSTESWPSGAVGSSRMSSFGLQRERLGELQQVLLGDGQADRRGPRGGRWKPTSSSSARIDDASSPGDRQEPRCGTATRMFSATVRSGSTAGCWWTMAMPSRLRRRRVEALDGLAVERRSCRCPGWSCRRRRPSAWTCRRRSRRAARAPRRAGRSSETSVRAATRAVALGDAGQRHRRLRTATAVACSVCSAHHVVLRLEVASLVTGWVGAAADGGRPPRNSSRATSADSAWSAPDISAER